MSMEYNPAALPAIDAAEVVCLDNERVTRVTGELAQKLARLWRELPPGQQMRCHIPPFAFRFYSGQNLLIEASVCWQCNNIHLERAGEKLLYEFAGEGAISQKLLNLAKLIAD